MFKLGGNTDVVDTLSPAQNELLGSAGSTKDSPGGGMFGPLMRKGGGEPVQEDPSGVLGLLTGLLSDPLNPANNPFARLLQTNPEFDAATSTFESIIKGTSGQFDELLGSAQPVFQENFDFGLSRLNSAAPTTRGSEFGNQAIDFATRHDNAFNLFAEQAATNLRGQQIQAAGALGQLGQQNIQNFINPTLNLLLSAISAAFGQPNTAVVQQPGFYDYLSQGFQTAAGVYTGANGGGGGGGGNVTNSPGVGGGQAGEF